MIHCDDNKVLGFHNPEEATVKLQGFASLALRSVFLKDGNLYRDHFAPSMTKGLKDCVCPFFFLAFPCKTQMLRHRRSAHHGLRASKFELDISLDIDIETSAENSAIKEIIDHRSIRGSNFTEYLCVLNGSSQEWRIVACAHELVTLYELTLANLSTNIEVMTPADPRWMYMIFEEVDSSQK